MIRLNFAPLSGKTNQWVFTHPTTILVAHRLDEVQPVLCAAEQAANQGHYAVGYVSYEAAPAFESSLTVRSGARMPLAWFGIFEAPKWIIDDPASYTGYPSVIDWHPLISRAQYQRAIADIREAIAAGDTYQLNYTMRFQASFSDEDYALYRQLRMAQPAPYSAYLQCGRYRVLSLSPELFFQRYNNQIVTRPMKGTAPRGRWADEDEASAAWLTESEKNRAENLMIVDLLRNDLGRVAEIGSVQVPNLFQIERYPTVLQMTSTVTAIERPGTRLIDIFRALFPCGSVTGAPKVRTMQLIADLEQTPREVYCGAIGVIEPGGNATFNVAIRTLYIDTTNASAIYGVGGGITWDSTADDEYTEALSKTALLHESWPSFDLLETLRLKRGKYALLDAHLQRLADSARYFDVHVDLAAVRAELERVANNCCSDTPAQETNVVQHRVRVQVSRNGHIDVKVAALPPLLSGPAPVALARTPVMRRDRFLFHKTTHRAVYTAQRRLHPHVFDVLLWNEAGELTEFTIGNLALRLDGRLWTPARESGLLAGVFRNVLLQRGTLAERVLRREDLARASEIWLINSVRGWIPVTLRDAL
jgi:para-aminobenzoate synthetase/4-amino-4-deoxychorismate lyase